MRNFAALVILVVALTGCIFQEPYPGWKVDEIAYGDLPTKIRTAFRNDFGAVRVTRVERSTFESRNSGFPKKYQLFFEKPEAGIQRVIYNKNGMQDDGFDFWFNQAGRPRAASE